MCSSSRTPQSSYINIKSSRNPVLFSVMRLTQIPLRIIWCFLEDKGIIMLCWDEKEASNIDYNYVYVLYTESLLNNNFKYKVLFISGITQKDEILYQILTNISKRFLFNVLTWRSSTWPFFHGVLRHLIKIKWDKKGFILKRETYTE